MGHTSLRAYAHDDVDNEGCVFYETIQSGELLLLLYSVYNIYTYCSIVYTRIYVPSSLDQILIR